ncbi:MAG: hypothetical protein ACE15C_21620 [Phycisphaerae bacterium]
MPSEDFVLKYDRTFVKVSDDEARNLVAVWGQGQPCPVSFKLPPQGQLWDFSRQGAPGELSVTTMGQESFCIITWVIIIGIGVAMLKLNGFQRTLIVLAAALVMLIIGLSAPLFVRPAARMGGLAVLLVVVLWAAQWIFFRLPRKARAATSPPTPTGPPVAPPTAPPPATPPQGAPSSAEGSQSDQASTKE